MTVLIIYLWPLRNKRSKMILFVSFAHLLRRSKSSDVSITRSSVHFVQGGVELPHVKVLLHETIRNDDF